MCWRCELVGGLFFWVWGGDDARVCGVLSESEVPRDAKRVGERVVTFSGVWGVQGLTIGVVEKNRRMDG